MRKPLNRSFAELVLENKREIMKDEKAMEKIEARIEERHLAKTE